MQLSEKPQELCKHDYFLIEFCSMTCDKQVLTRLVRMSRVVRGWALAGSFLGLIVLFCHLLVFLPPVGSWEISSGFMAW